MENNNDTHRIKRSSSAWLGEMREFLRGRFSLDEDKAASVMKLLDVLEDNDDVQNVWANFEVDEAVMAKLSA